MRQATAIMIAFFLSSCAGRDLPLAYHDMTDANRQNTALHADVARCEFNIMASRQGMPWIPPDMMRACMTARGWQAVDR